MAGCASKPSHPPRVADAYDRPPSISPYASRILSALEDRDIHELIERWPVIRALPQEVMEYEWVHVASVGDVMSDGFQYALLIDHKKKQFWINRSGGIAGITQLTGPAALSDTDQIQFVRTDLPDVALPDVEQLWQELCHYVVVARPKLAAAYGHRMLAEATPEQLRAFLASTNPTTDRAVHLLDGGALTADYPDLAAVWVKMRSLAAAASRTSR